MKTILVFVTSLDGKITKWGYSNIKAWSSKSDQLYFSKLWNESPLIIMGSKTYEGNPPTPSPDHLVIVMSKKTSTFKELQVPGQLEFTDDTPIQIFERFKKDGYQQMTVVGGSQVATSFLKEQLIDEIWLTIEPFIFGSGGNFVVQQDLDISLKLLHCDKVNEQGTLITKYAVQKK